MTLESKHMLIAAAAVVLVLAATGAPTGTQAAAADVAASRPATQPTTRADNHSKKETKRTPAALSRLLPMRVGRKWCYDCTTVTKRERFGFLWTVRCAQVARADGVQGGIFVHDYDRVKQAPSTPALSGRFALVLLPAHAWFIRLTDVEPSARPAIAEKELLALADKLRKSVAEDRIPEGLEIMGLLAPGKPGSAGPDYPAKFIGAGGKFFGGYPPWWAVRPDDPHVKHMWPKPKGKLSAWIKQIEGAHFRAWGGFQPGVGLLRLSWFAPTRIRTPGYWMRLRSHVTERMKLLKKHVGKFRLTLKHLNPRGPNIRPVVRLTVAEMGVRVRTWRISKAQAVKIIDHLAAEGFLESSRDIFVTKAPKIAGPCCVLSVGGPPRVSLEENLGWDLKMLGRLDALRKILDDKAAKAMAEFIKALEPQRKKWEARTQRDVKRRRVCLAALREIRKGFAAVARKYPKGLGHLGPGAIDEKKLLLRFPVKGLPKTTQPARRATPAGRMRSVPRRLRPDELGLFVQFTVPMPIVDFPTQRPMARWLFSNVGFSWWWMWPNRSFSWKAQQDLMKMLSQALVPLNELENAMVAPDLAKRGKGSYVLRGRPGVKLTLRLAPKRAAGGSPIIDLYATNETKKVVALCPPFPQIIGDGKPWHYRAHGSLSMLTHAFGRTDPFIYIKPGQTAKVSAVVAAGLSPGKHTVRVAARHGRDAWIDPSPMACDGPPITRKVPGAWTGVLVSNELAVDIPAPAAANKKAAERAKMLEKKVDDFALVLRYHGPGKVAFSTLMLSVKPPQGQALAAKIASITQPDASPRTKAREKVERLVAQLGAESYKDHEAAQKALVKMGKSIVPLLKPYLKSPDPEIRQRIQDILEQLGVK